MTNSDSGKYMIRRKFYIPKNEITRLYINVKDPHPFNYGFSEVIEDEDSDVHEK